MNKTIGLLAVGGVLAALVAGYLAGRTPTPKAADSLAAFPPAKEEEEKEAPSKTEEAKDVEAIKKAGQSFVKAFLAGDAKAVAALWTANGEYLSDDGTSLRGRAEIEKFYAGVFAKRDKKEKLAAEIEVTSIRFPSKDTAIEEGYFKVRAGKDAPVSGRYTVLHAREGGKWLMAVVREWPSEGASLRDLEWLIGSWQAKRDDVEVKSTYEWWGEKTFIRCTLRITRKGRTTEGFQMIGKDASTGQLRSWTFDPDGSFAESTWARDGRKWVQDVAGVQEDGGVITATHVLTRIDNDTFTFQAVERTVDGEPVEDAPPVRVTRVKSK
jgi:uncharacterized protein (TIGR02246 family)